MSFSSSKMANESSSPRLLVESMVRNEVEGAMVEFTALVKDDIVAFVQNEIEAAMRLHKKEAAAPNPMMESKMIESNVLESAQASAEALITDLEGRFSTAIAAQATRLVDLEAKVLAQVGNSQVSREKDDIADIREMSTRALNVAIEANNATGALLVHSKDGIGDLRETLATHQGHLDVIRRNIASLDRKYRALSEVVVPGAMGSSRGGTPMVMSPVTLSRAPSPGRTGVPTANWGSNTPMAPMPPVALFPSGSAPRAYSPGRDRASESARFQPGEMPNAVVRDMSAPMGREMPMAAHGHQPARSLSPSGCRHPSPAPSASTLGGGSMLYPSTNVAFRAASPEPVARGGSSLVPVALSPPVPGMARQPSPVPQMAPPMLAAPSYIPVEGVRSAIKGGAEVPPPYAAGRQRRRSQNSEYGSVTSTRSDLRPGHQYGSSMNSTRSDARAVNQYSEHASLIRATPFAHPSPPPINSVNVPVPVDNTPMGHTPKVAMRRQQSRPGPGNAAAPVMAKSLWV